MVLSENPYSKLQVLCILRAPSDNAYSFLHNIESRLFWKFVYTIWTFDMWKILHTDLVIPHNQEVN